MRSQAIENPVCVVAFRNDFEALFPCDLTTNATNCSANAFSSKNIRHFRMGDDHAVA
jgi:hypothetical protein